MERPRVKILAASCTSCTQTGRPWRSKKLTGVESGRPLENSAGSATTVFAVDEIAILGIVPEPTDRIRRLVGIGGIELVLAKRIESLALGDIQVQNFPIQIGTVKYGFP